MEIKWPENPQCSVCKTKPCGTYHVAKDGPWHSLCCKAPLVVVKKPAVKVGA